MPVAMSRLSPVDPCENASASSPWKSPPAACVSTRGSSDAISGT